MLPLTMEYIDPVVIAFVVIGIFCIALGIAFWRSSAPKVAVVFILLALFCTGFATTIVVVSDVYQTEITVYSHSQNNHGSYVMDYDYNVYYSDDPKIFLQIQDGHTYKVEILRDPRLSPTIIKILQSDFVCNGVDNKGC